MSRDRHEI